MSAHRPWLPLLALTIVTACGPKKVPEADLSAPDAGAAVAASETPEMPFKALAPPNAGTASRSTAPGAVVVKFVPAPDSEVKAEPPKPMAMPSTHDPLADASLQRAVEAARNNDPLTAERELKALVTRDPKLDYAWTDLGVVYEREAVNDQAEQSYRRALQINPEQELAWDYLTRLYCRTGRAARIEGELRQRIADNPASTGARIALVNALLREQKYDSAAAEAKKVLKADERNVRAMQLLAQVYYEQGKNELAKMVLDNAKAINANDAATYNALGLVSLALKQKPAAMEFFKQAATLKPDFAEALNNYGALLNETQDYDAAVHVLEAACNAAPDFASARLNLGNAYRGAGQLTKAIAQYKQVLRLNPSSPDPYYNLAILHLDSDIPNMDSVDRYKTAISYFQDYRSHGGNDENVDQYLKDAGKGIEKEERRKERERKDQLRKAEKEAAARKAADEKAAQERIAAEKAAAEAAQRAARAPPPETGNKLRDDDVPPPASSRRHADKNRKPASRLGDDSTTTVPASSKLGDQDK